MTEKRGPGRPATGQTPAHSIRIGPVWDEAKAAAKADGTTFAVFVEMALRAEIKRRAKRSSGSS
jgi:hypothetical protein